MVERGWGRLITTTSHGATGLLGQPIFAAAMGGVISMTRAIAFELESAGVTANCLAPGGATRLHAVTRPMFEQLRADELISEAEWDSYENTPPPEYVAPIVAWLCTDDADGVTGQVFHASGGAVGVWNRYEVERTIYRGDHRDNPPWSLAELDTLVPKALLSSPDDARLGWFSGGVATVDRACRSGVVVAAVLLALACRGCCPAAHALAATSCTDGPAAGVPVAASDGVTRTDYTFAHRVAGRCRDARHAGADAAADARRRVR